MIHCTRKEATLPKVKSSAIHNNRYVFNGLRDKKHNRQLAPALND